MIKKTGDAFLWERKCGKSAVRRSIGEKKDKKFSTHNEARGGSGGGKVKKWPPIPKGELPVLWNTVRWF